MLGRLLFLLLGVVLILIAGGFLLPRTVVVERTILIEQPPELVHAVMRDFRHLEHWSPWHARSPEAGYRLEGPAQGPGATLVWGGGEAGGESGRLWIESELAPRRIDLRMELGETSEAESWFEIVPSGLDSEVSWGMRMHFGTFDLTGRYLGLMLPGLVGRDYQAGLERLKAYLEARPRGVEPNLEHQPGPEDELLPVSTP